MNKRLANFLVGPRWRQFSSRIYAFKGVEYRSASLYGVGYSTGLLLIPSEGLRRGAESKHSWEASLRRDPRVVAVLTGDEFCGYPTHHARPASKLGRQQRQELLQEIFCKAAPDHETLQSKELGKGGVDSTKRKSKLALPGSDRKPA